MRGLKSGGAREMVMSWRSISDERLTEKCEDKGGACQRIQILFENIYCVNMRYICTVWSKI